MELAPVLKQFVSKHFPLPSTQEKNGEILREDSEGSPSSMKTYFEKMPSPCYVSQRRGQIDRQGVAAIVSQAENILSFYICVLCIPFSQEFPRYNREKGVNPPCKLDTKL